MTRIHQPAGKLSKSLRRLKLNVPEFFVKTFDEILGFHFNSAWPIADQSTHIRPDFFILGSGRSGNTLLRRLLMENYSVYIPPEIPGLGRSMRRFRKTRRLNWHTTVKETLREFDYQSDISVPNPVTNNIYNLKDELKIDYDTIESNLFNVPESKKNGATIFDALYSDMYRKSQFGDVDNHELKIGDKTPWSVFYSRQISEMFPKTKFIHLVRDPHAVCYSYMTGLSAVTGDSITDAAYRWRASVSRCINLGERISNDRFMELRYEDLVRHPSAALSSIADFLQLSERSTAMDVEEINKADAKLIQHSNISNKVSDKSINLWREGLTLDEVKIIKKITESTVKKLAVARKSYE